MKVILFEKKNNFMSWIISFFTSCDITHAAVMIDGVVYDASESRGGVSKVGSIDVFGGRNVFLYDIDLTDIHLANARLFAHGTVGRKYDWHGVLGWVFGFKGKRKRFYCFEYVWECMRAAGVDIAPKHQISGCDLSAVLGRTEYVGAAEDYIEYK